jgi:hypothetical protein
VEIQETPGTPVGPQQPTGKDNPMRGLPRPVACLTTCAALFPHRQNGGGRSYSAGLTQPSRTQSAATDASTSTTSPGR